MEEARKSTAALAASPNAPNAPRPQVVQLVRSIGANPTSEVQTVASVNAELESLYAKGFKPVAIRPVGAVPGGMTVYYMFVKGV